MAELEAASVEAFRVMRVELVHHGAPTHLRAQAIRAERDEVRHARIARRLARRFGAERRSLPFSDHPVRSLESIALENVVEGCVRETFGALIARWQSRSALDPDVARIMRRIADDETRHAALAWRVGLWIEPRMAEASRVEARRAMTDAVRVLREGLREPSPELRRIAGLPRVAESRAMLAALQDLVWRQRLRAA